MDRDHVHMNSTRWLTLSQFTEWLGKNGYCEVDYQEGKGMVSFVKSLYVRTLKFLYVVQNETKN